MYTTYTTTHARTHARIVQRPRAACFPVSQLPKVDDRAARSEKENRKKYFLREGRVTAEGVGETLLRPKSRCVARRFSYFDDML